MRRSTPINTGEPQQFNTEAKETHRVKDSRIPFIIKCPRKIQEDMVYGHCKFSKGMCSQRYGNTLFLNCEEG